MTDNSYDKLCQYQDCNEPWVVTIGKLGANACFKHAKEYQRLMAWRLS